MSKDTVLVLRGIRGHTYKRRRGLLCGLREFTLGDLAVGEIETIVHLPHIPSRVQYSTVDPLLCESSRMDIEVEKVQMGRR